MKGREYNTQLPFRMNNLIHRLIHNNNIASLAGNVSSAFFGLLSFVLLARSFPSDVFGEWVIYLTSATFVEMFRFGLTRSALVRFLSGAEGQERRKLTGSNYAVGILITLVIVIVLYLLLLIFRDSITGSSYRLFFIWYPLLAIANLPFNNALTIMQAELKFYQILVIRTLSTAGFVLVLALNYFLNWNLSLHVMVIAHLGINALTSTISIFRKWDGLTDILYTNLQTLKTLLHFGKYTTITLIGSNLLRSADTFIISLSPMGSIAVALYAIPLKLTEMLQIPLRSFAATAYPIMSKASIQNETGKFKYYFYSYTGAITLLFVPVVLFGYIFAETLILILGGPEYLKPDLVPGEDAVFIFRIFVLYGLMLPLDRMTGVALDAINQPRKNFYKILFMVGANIVGDLVAVFVFDSLALVAVATWVFTFIGMVVGYFYLKQEVEIQFRKIITVGFKSIRDFLPQKRR